MSRRAWIYVLAVILAGAVLTALALPGASRTTSQWPVFGALVLLATLAQLFKARAPGHQSYHPALVFLFAGLLLLHPALFAFLVLACHAGEWAKERLLRSARLRAWYLQPFNIAMHIIAGWAAHWTIAGIDSIPFTAIIPSSVLSATAAAFVYVAVNHLVTGVALMLARGVSWRESGVLDVENLLTDLVLLWLGYVVASLWRTNPLLVLPALSPLLLMYRALMVPQLQKEARTDGKTGLLNARYFSECYATEMERAARFERPMAVIMSDLDLLRNINNTYGHLAGDQVLAGIGQTIRDTIGEFDLAGRFGGEEFAILLPEAELGDAMAFAEELRRNVDATEFDVATSSEPIHVTISLGVACFPQDAVSPTNLIHAADMAVYQAKLNGRNQVISASEVPHSAKLNGTPLPDRLKNPYAPNFFPRPYPENDHTDSRSDPPAGPQVVGVDTLAVRHATQPAAPAGRRVVDTKAASGTAVTRRTTGVLYLFVGAVIATGVGLLAGLGLQLRPWPNPAALGLLTGLALITQLLQLKNLYGESSVSVSAGINFTAALIAGIPGVIAVSGVIAVAHALQRRPSAYKVAFNWATHVLSASVPVIVMRLLGIEWRLGNLPLLAVPTLVCALLYYLIETGLVATAISLSEGSSVLRTWRERYRWLAEHYAVLGIIGLFLALAHASFGPLGLLVFTLPILMMYYAQRQFVERSERGVRELRRMNEELSRANREILGASEAIRELNGELLLTISEIADARDPYVSSHSSQVAEYAVATGREMGLSEEHLEHLRQGGLLHDIGKIGIPERVLRKPGELTDEEYEKFKDHTILGRELIDTCKGLRHLVPFIEHHHEWWNGRGYPGELRGEQTPLGARILSVCDAVDAMSSDRPYRVARPRSDVIAELKRCSGVQFDPEVVAAFCRLAERAGDDLVVNSADRVMQQSAERWSGLGFGVPELAFA
jgi:diguanylate cyclase (GGDEF)-like protein/putative nucleotidyltransferase with HDIG domain